LDNSGHGPDISLLGATVKVVVLSSSTTYSSLDWWCYHWPNYLHYCTVYAGSTYTTHRHTDKDQPVVALVPQEALFVAGSVSTG